MGEIGKPDDHYTGKLSQRQDNYSNSGGFIEERLAKLEYEVRDINDTFNNLSQCMFCYDPINKIPGGDHSRFPVCNDCRKAISIISCGRKNTKFIE